MKQVVTSVLEGQWVFGSFFYNNEKEKGRQYCNTYSATPGTPYMYTDTIGNDIFSREEFGLTGALSYSLSSKLLIGGEVSYQAGLGAQDRDPRAENKVSLTGVKMGALYEMNSWLKVGGSIYYNYYNEDIDIDVVEENSTYFLFNLTGLGTYSKHESSSFYRLYERTSIGEEVQVELKNHLLTVGYQQFYEDVYDGRKESGASWSAVKHDSEYRNETMNIAYVYTLSRNQTVHQLRLDASHKNYVGAEILQELRQIDEQYSVYQWKTLSKEDKYKREDTHLGFKYEFTQFNTDLQRRYWLGMDMVYYKHSENYYIPDLSVSYSNLSAHARCGRYFGFKKSGINLSFSYGRVKNIEREIALPFQTFISDLMIVPDYNYYSSEAEELGARLVYDFKLSDENKVYIRFDYKNLHHLNHSVKRTQFNITLGTVL